MINRIYKYLISKDFTKINFTAHIILTFKNNSYHSYSMDAEMFWKGVLVGFMMAVPLGPMGVLCIKRTLSRGKKSGFITGLGIATIDALYGSVATLGIAFVAAFILTHKIVIQSIGISILFYLAIIIFNEKPANLIIPKSTTKNLAKDYGSAAILTLCNPITILSFIAALAAVDIVNNLGQDLPLKLILGIFIGSMLWWSILSFALGSVRHKLTKQQMRLINKIASGIILVFGLALLIQVLRTIN